MTGVAIFRRMVYFCVARKKRCLKTDKMWWVSPYSLWIVFTDMRTDLYAAVFDAFPVNN